MSDMYQDIAEYIRLSKDSIDLIKGAWSLLPTGGNKDEAERSLRAAEEALKRSDAALAMKLGYNLCQCTFPPQIMLREKSSGERVCGNCGHKTNFNRSSGDYEDEWISGRR